MCGISAWITNDRISRRDFERYNETVRHRGPDDSGYYYDTVDNNSIALGHQRLSIIDLSQAGHQPMQFGEYVIVFNGEIFNYLEIREELLLRGVEFVSRSDTEVLLQAFIQWGKACLHKLNGMFAFVIFDKSNRQLFAARDRFGIKPLYYLHDESRNCIYFASEIKQFATLSFFRSTGNLGVIKNFVINRYVDYSAETFFYGVYQLQGGECCTVYLSTMSLVIEQWYRLEEHVCNNFSSDPDDFYDLFVDSVKLRMRSDVEVGSCLSGGLDSSSIVCLADDIIGNTKNPSLRTFTSSFEEKEFDERRYVHLIAEERNICCDYSFPSIQNFFENIEQLTYSQDEPFWSSSIFAQKEVFSAAHAQNIKVMLDGQGADEILGGYTSIFYPCYIKSLLSRTKIIELLAESVIARRKRQFIRVLLSQFDRQQPADRNLADIFKGTADIIEMEQEKSFSSFRDCSLYMMRYHLPALLHYDDRNSMSYSIESRLPFLDYRLVEFSLKLSGKEKIGGQISKRILRKKMKGIVPDGILARRDKMGFVTPQNRWISDNIGIFFDSLKVLQETSLFNNAYLDKFQSNFTKNKLDFNQLMRLYTFTVWLKVFNVGGFNG